MLAAYAQDDPELGYTQGMNFVAACIFLAVQDEYIAYAIFRKLLISKEQGGCDWRRFYITDMPKLMEMTDAVKHYLSHNISSLEKHFTTHQVFLETQLVSPYMALFSNLVTSPVAFKILDRFIFFGEEVMTELVCNAFNVRQEQIISINCPFELQHYLTRDVYLDTIKEGKFFPEVESVVKKSGFFRRMINKI